jgi:hypothetical protein
MPDVSGATSPTRYAQTLAGGGRVLPPLTRLRAQP